MAKKLPSLNEVFLVSGARPINVGSAYSLKREGGFPNKKNLQGRTYGSNIGRGRMSESDMKPELEKIVQKHSKGDPKVAEMLRAFAHDMEAGEGEDPAELDKDGPPAGSTGGSAGPGEGQRDPTKGFNGGGDL
jgi:hypothetical protein